MSGHVSRLGTRVRVFINHHLVVTLGGVHAAESAKLEVGVIVPEVAK